MSLIDDAKQAGRLLDQVILKVLAVGPMTAAALAANLGRNLRAIQRRLKKLAAAGQVRRVGKEYCLPEADRAGNGQPGHGGNWWWDSLPQPDSVRAEPSQADPEVDDQASHVSNPSPTPTVPALPPRQAAAKPTWSETEARLRQLWTQGYHDQGGNENQARLIAGKRIRLFLATRGLLGATDMPAEILSQVYLQGRADSRREIEQAEREEQVRRHREAAERQRREVEERRQAEELGLQIMAQVVRSLQYGDFSTAYRILSKPEYELSPNERQQWINIARKLVNECHRF